MFAYPDAARYRLGVNYQQLPTNSARSPVYCPFQRDGLMNFSSNYGDDPDYIGSSLRPTTFATSPKGNYVSSTITEHERWIGEVCSFTSAITDQDFEQPAALWKVLRREPGQQDRFVDNVADSVQKVTSAKLRASVYGMLFFSHSPSRGVMSSKIYICICADLLQIFLPVLIRSSVPGLKKIQNQRFTESVLAHIF